MCDSCVSLWEISYFPQNSIIYVLSVHFQELSKHYSLTFSPPYLMLGSVFNSLQQCFVLFKFFNIQVTELLPSHHKKCSIDRRVYRLKGNISFPFLSMSVSMLKQSLLELSVYI